MTFIKAPDVEKTGYFNSKPKVVTNDGEIRESLQEAQQYILAMIGSWISEGSGWTTKSIVHHYVNIIAYKPLNGSSYI